MDALSYIDMNLLTELSNNHPRKNVRKYAKLIYRHFQEDRPKSVRPFSFKSVNCIKEVKWLSSYLFVFGDYDECFKVCSFLDGMNFTGDYTIWQTVCQCRMLKCALYRQNGDEAKAQEEIVTISPFEKPELYQAAWETVIFSGQELIKEWNGEYYKVTPSARNRLRQMALDILVICNEYIQKNALPELQCLMSEWICKITDFMRQNDL